MKSDSLGQLSRVPFNVVYGIYDPSEKLFLTRSLKLVGTSTLLYVELRSRDPLCPS